MHRPDPDRDGYVLCGRPMDSHAAVHAENPGFDACAECAVFAGEPTSGDSTPDATALVEGNPGPKPKAQRRKPPRPVPRPRPAPSPVERPRRAPVLPAAEKRQPVGGWVLLRGRLLHRPDPVARDRVICGQQLLAKAQVFRNLPAGAEPCTACAAGLRPQHRDKRRSLGEARRQKAVRQTSVGQSYGREPAPLTGGQLRAWRSVGWVVLAGSGRAHHPHPLQDDRVLCGRLLPVGVPVRHVVPDLLPACGVSRDCAAGRRTSGCAPS